jgi:hypothetical protein
MTEIDDDIGGDEPCTERVVADVRMHLHAVAQARRGDQGLHVVVGDPPTHDRNVHGRIHLRRSDHERVQLFGSVQVAWRHDQVLGTAAFRGGAE